MGLFHVILRNFSPSFWHLSLEKGILAFSFGKKIKNLTEMFYENKQNKPITQVKKSSLFLTEVPLFWAWFKKGNIIYQK